VQVNTQKKKKEIKMPGRTALPEACGDFLFARKEKAGKKRVGEETEIMNHPGIDRHIDEHAQLGWKKKAISNLVSKSNDLLRFFCFFGSGC